MALNIEYHVHGLYIQSMINLTPLHGITGTGPHQAYIKDDDKKVDIDCIAYHICRM